MAVTSHKAVMAGVTLLGDRQLARAAKGIRKDLDPLIPAIRGAKSAADLKRKLGATLLKRMKTDAAATALADAGVQAGMIGVVAAKPRGRRNGEGGMRKGG